MRESKKLCCTEYTRLPVFRTRSTSVGETIKKDNDCTNKAAHKSPSLFRYLIRIGDRFHKRFVHNSRLGYPNGTQEVNPVSEHGLFEGAPLIRAQDA